MTKDYFTDFNRLLGELEEAAVSSGAKADGCTPTNALRFLKKKSREYDELQQKAESLGYTSAAHALKALGQKKDTSLVPLDLTIAPSHWVVEEGVTRHEVMHRGEMRARVYKRKAVTEREAQRLCNAMQPHLNYLLEIVKASTPEDLDSFIEEVRENFLSKSYEDFIGSIQDELRYFFGQETASVEEEEVPDGLPSVR